MGQILGSALQQGDNVLAVCDVDARQIAHLKKGFSAPLERANVHEDYRQLLELDKSVDAVVIAAGQRWHVPMSKAAMLAAKSIPVILPRAKGPHERMARRVQGTFQGFDTAACEAEIAMVAMRLGKPIEWDSDDLQVKGLADAEPLVHLEQRKKWLSPHRSFRRVGIPRRMCSDRRNHLGTARSQAPAWERTALPALPA